MQTIYSVVGSGNFSAETRFEKYRKRSERLTKTLELQEFTYYFFFFVNVSEHTQYFRKRIFAKS